ncbi:MAG: FAD-dependent oxidoreductase [Armatimonadota bacterium]|nr:MAG: FAD-dependent oxidoreductase [Armatimonadota bacterium]
MSSRQTDKAAADRYDLVVYGGSPAGIGAAVAAAREGLRVLLAEPLGRVGGMVTGGLCRTDIGRPETVGGIFREFMSRVVRYYGQHFGAESEQVEDCRGGERFEPHVALAVLTEMLQEAGVAVGLRRTVAGAEVGEGELRAVELSGPDGRARVAAPIFVDASYEGDLLASAGARYCTGREARDEYDEEFAGHLFWDPGRGRATEHGTGEGDNRIQAYCFRMTVTDDSARLVPIEKPASYSPDRYELLAKYLAGGPRRLKDVLLMGKLPNRKWDVNNWGFCWQSMDFIEGNSGYVEGTWEQRREIAQRHREYQWGLLYFLQNDRSVPSELREEVGRFGLCSDEFTKGGGWPKQLYVREARRLVGRYLFTERDARQDLHKSDTVAVGSYPLDSHATQWYRIGQATPAPEGFFMCSVQPYEIPYRCLLPASLTNLLVPVCLSATHAGYGTLRMEPVMMNLGMVCGTAAALARDAGGELQRLAVSELQAKLEARGQIIRAA